MPSFQYGAQEPALINNVHDSHVGVTWNTLRVEIVWGIIWKEFC